MWSALVSLSLLSACVSGGATKGSGCSWVKPIYVSGKDVLTSDTIRQIVIHNETWEAICQ